MIEIYSRLSNKESVEKDILSNLDHNRVNALNYLGRYSECVEAVARHYDWRQSMDLSLVMAKTLMRQGKYDDAIEILGNIESGNSVDSRGIVSVYRIRNVILRDLERYDEAVLESKYLLENFVQSEEQIDGLLKAKCMRTVARASICISDFSNAENLAVESLSLSESNDSLIDVANSHFCLGEVYRYIGYLEESIERYKSASRIAGNIASMDTYLWSQLGLADSHYLKGDWDSSTEIGNALCRYLKNNKKNYPIESSHAEFLVSVSSHDPSDHASAIELPDHYVANNLRWPTEYIVRLNAGQFCGPKRF